MEGALWHSETWMKPVFLSGLEAEGSIIYHVGYLRKLKELMEGHVPCAVAAAMSSGQSKNACIYLLIACVSVQKVHVSKYNLTQLKKIRDIFKGPELGGKIIIQAFLNLNFAIT